MRHFIDSWGEITKRIVTGGLLAAVVLFLTLYHPLTFYLLIVIAALLMQVEWLELTRDQRLLNRLGSLIYVGVPVMALMTLYQPGNPEHVLVLFALVWATDIAAYAGGKRYGNHKIWPAISPGKTWEGLGFGIMGCMVVAAIASYFATFPDHPLEALLIGLIIAPVAQIGDFFESWIKRRAGVKDSGVLLPGHGGILDRVDGIVTAAPVYVLLVALLAD